MRNYRLFHKGRKNEDNTVPPDDIICFCCLLLGLPLVDACSRDVSLF